jgi:DNA-binding CsgD family transcriptional regulator
MATDRRGERGDGPGDGGQADSAALCGLLHDLHEGAQLVPRAEFRGCALRELRRLLRFSGALWGSGSCAARRLHGVHVEGDWSAGIGPAALAPAIERWFHAVACEGRADRGTEPGAVRGEPPPEQGTPAGMLLVEPLRIGARDLATAAVAAVERPSGLTAFIALTRDAADAPFSTAERGLVEQVAPHLRLAWRHCQLADLQAREAAGRDRSAALVDPLGHVHVADPRFFAMLRGAWPDWTGARLPPALGEALRAGRAAVLGEIRWTAEDAGELRVLTGTRVGALGRLTPRERTIAAAIAAGEPYASAASRLRISVNMLRNTTVRVYRKLGVRNRVELARRLGAGPGALGDDGVAIEPEPASSGAGLAHARAHPPQGEIIVETRQPARAADPLERRDGTGVLRARLAGAASVGERIAQRRDRDRDVARGGCVGAVRGRDALAPAHRAFEHRDRLVEASQRRERLRVRARRDLEAALELAVLGLEQSQLLVACARGREQRLGLARAPELEQRRAQRPAGPRHAPADGDVVRAGARSVLEDRELLAVGRLGLAGPAAGAGGAAIGPSLASAVRATCSERAYCACHCSTAACSTAQSRSRSSRSASTVG